MSGATRRWYAENRERCLAYAKRYREANREKVRAANRERWARDHEANLAAQRERRRLSPKSPSPITEHTRHVKTSLQAERRARLRGATVERVDRLIVYERDGGICGICKAPVPIDRFHLDHIVPLAKGGEHSYANTQPAHPRCNESKRDRHDGRRAA